MQITSTYRRPLILEECAIQKTSRQHAEKEGTEMITQVGDGGTPARRTTRARDRTRWTRGKRCWALLGGEDCRTRRDGCWKTAMLSCSTGEKP